MLVFGSFDPLHPGHLWLFQQAKKYGNDLTVVVARDEVIRINKSREPHQSEQRRLAAVKAVPEVDQAVLGDKQPESYELLSQLDFQTLVVGYDQIPSDEEIYKVLQAIGKSSVGLIRLPAYKSYKYKSSFFRT